MSQLLSTISGLLLVAVVVTYLRQTVKGSSTPNPATWFICLVTMALNTTTYYFVSKENVWSVTTPSVITVGIFVICVYASITGKIGKVRTVEVVCFLLAFVAGYFWLETKDSERANVMVQIILILSLVPTIIGLLQGNLREKALPWSLATLSYCILVPAILVRENWTWVELIYPFVSGILGNGSVVIAIKWKHSREAICH